MKTIQTTPPSLEELAGTAVRLGRELNEMSHAVYAGGNSRDHGVVQRTLRRLAEREPFDSRDDASFLALRGIIDADLRSELVGSERRFVETHYDADGPNGEVRECPVYSERGEALLSVQDALHRFITARDATLDRIAAERTVLRLLRRSYG